MAYISSENGFRSTNFCSEGYNLLGSHDVPPLHKIAAAIPFFNLLLIIKIIYRPSTIKRTMKYRLTPGKSGNEDVKDFWKATCIQSYSHQSNTNLKK